MIDRRKKKILPGGIEKDSERLGSPGVGGGQKMFENLGLGASAVSRRLGISGPPLALCSLRTGEHFLFTNRRSAFITSHSGFRWTVT